MGEALSGLLAVPQCVNLAEFVPRLAFLRQYKVRSRAGRGAQGEQAGSIPGGSDMGGSVQGFMKVGYGRGRRPL